jgi:hypothetical protein
LYFIDHGEGVLCCNTSSLARNTPKHHVHRSPGIGDDHWQCYSDMADLIGEADAALSSTPSQNHMDLSTYLVQQYAQTDTKNTPVSLEAQQVPFDQESREVSALLDYLNDLSIDSPLRRTVDSPNRAPDPRGALRSRECL